MNKIKLHNKNNQLKTFKCWTRKNYSVFNSLNKIIKITAICIAYTIIVQVNNSYGQSDTTIAKKLDLEEIVVSAQKSPVLYSNLSRAVTVLDIKEIELLPAGNVSDVLKNISSVDLRERGVEGMQADISVRGGSFDQNLILLNGINISDPQTGHHSLNLPIDLNSIQKIEILEGPGSRVFGPNAFSGAINIITNDFVQNRFTTSFIAGDFGLFKGNIAGNFNTKEIHHFLSLSKSQSKGYTKNTDFKSDNFFYSAGYKKDIANINFQIGYTDKEFGANSFYTPQYPDQFEQTKTLFTSLKMETGSKVKLKPVVYFRQHKDRFELFRYEQASWYTGHNYHLTNVYGAKIDASIQWNNGVTTVGSEIRSENILSNVLGNLMNDTIEVNGEPKGFYNRKYNRSINSYYIEQTYYKEKFSISAGVLVNNTSEDILNFSFYPGVDISYRFNAIKTYLSVNRTMRLPTFTDLFYNGPSNIGNTELSPEEALNYELGFKLNKKFLYASVSVFYRDANNLIAWVKPLNAEPESKWETQNLTDVNAIGYRAKLTLETKKRILNSIIFDYSYLHQSTSSSIYATKYSLNYLKHNFISTLQGAISEQVHMAVNFKFRDRAGSYTFYDKVLNQYTMDKDFEPFWIVDLKLNYTVKKINLFSELKNAFDTDYTDIGNIAMPGRWFLLGIKYQIQY
jgi:vitamin B12 transporter